MVSLALFFRNIDQFHGFVLDLIKKIMLSSKKYTSIESHQSPKTKFVSYYSCDPSIDSKFNAKE
jgi:hypothetical protein